MLITSSEKENEMVMEIQPYDFHGMLVFDDASVGLDKEPFVQGVPEMLYLLCQTSGVRNPARGFKLKFSGEPFEGHQLEATKLNEESGGNWYEANGMKGWLCPALFKYFTIAPDKLYIRVENK